MANLANFNLIFPKKKNKFGIPSNLGLPLIIDSLIKKNQQGGRISDIVFNEMNRPVVVTPSGNIFLDVVKVLLPLAGSVASSFILKKGSETIKEFIKPNKQLDVIDSLTPNNVNEILKTIKIKNTDQDVQTSITKKSQDILNRIIKGSGIVSI